MDCYVCVAIVVDPSRSRHFGKVNDVEIKQTRVRTLYLLQDMNTREYFFSLNSGHITPGDVPTWSLAEAETFLLGKPVREGKTIRQLFKMGATKAYTKVIERGDPSFRIPKKGFCLKKSPSEAGRKKAA